MALTIAPRIVGIVGMAPGFMGIVGMIFLHTEPVQVLDRVVSET